MKTQPCALVRPSSVNFYQIFLNLSHETVPLKVSGPVDDESVCISPFSNEMSDLFSFLYNYLS